jgi:hypothetical protein
LNEAASNWAAFSWRFSLLKLLWVAVNFSVSILSLSASYVQAQSQSTAANQQRSMPLVHGRVIRAHNDSPLQGVALTLLTVEFEGPNAYREATVTDSNGEFHFKFAENRPYWVTAEADGFVKASYESDLFLGGSDLGRQEPSTPERGITFRLVRAAVIRGVLVSAEGKPVGAGVRMMAIGNDKGGSSSLYDTAVTDAQGKFTLKGLPPGVYCACENYRVTDSTIKIVVRTWGTYRETWSGKGLSAKGKLQIEEGQEQDDLRITIMPAKKYSVRVWPTGPEGIPAEAYYIPQLEHLAAGQRQADGSYLISGVVPGHYSLTTSAWTDADPWFLGQGETDFDVSNKDVTLHVTVGGMGTVQGVVRYEEQGQAIPAGTMIGIRALEGHGGGRKDIDLDGKFLFSRIPEGRYIFTLDHLPTETVWQSVKCNGIDVNSTNPLRVGAGDTVTGCELILESETK